MVRMVRDHTGRFPERPHYQPKELDKECELIITQFLRKLHGEARFPVETDDLTKLIEREPADLDLYADLSRHGPDVEGVTEFRPGRHPVVRIAADLSNDERLENRLRTTLTHEFGHVRFHAYLWAMRPAGDLFQPHASGEPSHCKRERLVGVHQETHGLFGPISADSDHGRTLIAAVGREFRVSHDAARVRLAKLGYLGSDTGPSLFR